MVFHKSVIAGLSASLLLITTTEALTDVSPSTHSDLPDSGAEKVGQFVPTSYMEEAEDSVSRPYKNTQGGEVVKRMFSRTARDSQWYADTMLHFVSLSGPKKASDGVSFYSVEFDVTPPLKHKIGWKDSNEPDECSKAIVQMRYKDFDLMWDKLKWFRGKFTGEDKEGFFGSKKFPAKVWIHTKENDEERRAFFEKLVEEAFRFLGDETQGVWVVKDGVDKEENYGRDRFLRSFFTQHHVGSMIYGLFACAA